MKKNLVRLVAISVIMTFVIFGCGKTESVVTEVNPSSEAEASKVEEKNPEPAQEEVKESEKVDEEHTETAVAEEVKEEESAEPQEEEEPLANELVMNSDPIDQWAATLGETNLKFIIYNDVEGYKQVLNDGEAYHMKKDDKIFLYHDFGTIEDRKFLTPEVRSGSGNEVSSPYGYDLVFLWDADVLTYGEELIISGKEPAQITCTFIKAEE